MTTMLAVQKTIAEPGLQMTKVNSPSIGDHDVLIAVAAVGICGTDLHADNWTASYAFMAKSLPVTLGHEFSGRITAVGARVTDFSLGDRVTVWPAVSCGRCQACRLDQAHNCEDKKTIGLHRNGAFAEFVSAPASNVFKLPDEVDFELAALVEPLTVAAHALEVADLRLGQSIAILGAGPIGLGAALLAKLAGASPVILVGLNDDARLRRANEIGIPHTIDLARDDLETSVNEIAGGKVDLVIEASGAAQSILDGFSILKTDGSLTAVGIHDRPVSLDLTTMVRSKHKLKTSHDSRRETWHRVLRLLATSGEQLRGMITHRLPLRDALTGFGIAHQGAASKVMLLVNER